MPHCMENTGVSNEGVGKILGFQMKKLAFIYGG
jgi:hypothetical protein